MKKKSYLPAVFIAADGATQMIQIPRPPQEVYDLELVVPPKFQPKRADWVNRRRYRLIEIIYNPLNGQLLGVYKEILI